MSEAKNCEVQTVNFPSLEQFVEYIKTQFEEMKKNGVIEVKEMNISLVDLSEAEKVSIKEKPFFNFKSI